MRKILLVLITVGLFPFAAFAQVKSSYLYNTSMPYGTLDIRTYISSSQYYYLQEGKTFAYRESSPGVRTYKYRDMTSWESSPYAQGNMRYKNGTSDKFVMNYRLLKPVNYTTSYSAGYPMIVILHGGVERGNCYYNSCFHSDWLSQSTMRAGWRSKRARNASMASRTGRGCEVIRKLAKCA